MSDDYFTSPKLARNWEQGKRTKVVMVSSLSWRGSFGKEFEVMEVTDFVGGFNKIKWSRVVSNSVVPTAVFESWNF